MRLLTLFLFVSLAACGGEKSDGSDAGSTDDASSAASDMTGGTDDASSTGDDAGPANNDGNNSPADAGAPDVGGGGEDAGMSMMPDAGDTLPTECINDCLCESSCDHRCNIQCRSECAAGTCNFEMNAGGEITCRAGTSCSISCESGACEVTCEAGAECELRCGPQTVFCDFVDCGGQVESCGARTTTCGKAC